MLTVCPRSFSLWEQRLKKRAILLFFLLCEITFMGKPSKPLSPPYPHTPMYFLNSHLLPG